MLRENIENFEKTTNLYVYTTFVTASVTAAISLFKLLAGWQFDIVETMVYFIAFWIVFFLTTKLILRTAKRRK